MDNRVGELRVLLRVVEAGSFSAAARKLGMVPSSVSKLVDRLEERLGVRLLTRSTRKLALTREGAHYVEEGAAIVERLDTLDGEVSKGGAHTKGIVRVTASVGFGARGVVPLLPGFWRSFPDVTVDLSLSDEMVDLYLDRTDVAFRVGKLVDSSLTARKLGAARRKIVAAPSYLRRHGVPRTLEDLDAHLCLGFNFRRAAPVWPLDDGERVVERAVRSRFLGNSGELVHALALSGAGLARLAGFHVDGDLARGTLTEVLPQFVDTEDVHALFPGGERVPRRVRAFLDYVVPRLQDFLRDDGAPPRDAPVPRRTRPSRRS